MKKALLLLALMCGAINYAETIELECTYNVDAMGQTRGPNMSQNIGSVFMTQTLHIKDDKLEKYTMIMNDSDQKIVENHEDSSVRITDNSISVSMPTLNTASVQATANLKISRLTGDVSGVWRMRWLDHAIVGDEHRVDGKCKKFEKAF